MLSNLLSVVNFLVTIGILIGIHKFGHFWVAKRCGIKVLRFAIGFGPVIWRKKDKANTEYVISVIPLGGYVKMLDEREGKVAVTEQHLAFNRQPVYKRALVVFAGPLFNLFLAILAFWLMLIIGIKMPLPIIGKVVPASIAEQAQLQAGARIQSVQGQFTPSWQSVAVNLLEHLGDAEQVQIEMIPVMLASQGNKLAYLNLANWKLDGLHPQLLESIGIIPYHPIQAADIATVFPGQPAARAGLEPGDKILAINHKAVSDWEELTLEVKKHPKQQVQLTVLRHHTPMTLAVEIGEHGQWLGKSQGYLGIATKPVLWPKEYVYERHFSILNGLWPALAETISFIKFNLIVLKKLIAGTIAIESIGGPISIFQGTHSALSLGIANYLFLLGLLSVTLAVINCLPIPGLDGSHLLYLFIETIKGSPVSLRFQMLAFRLGMIFLIVIMIQAMVNDVQRLYAS